MNGLWISVKDRLPAPFIGVLGITTEREEPACLWLSTSGEWRRDCGKYSFSPDFWMPLPPPPTTGAST